MYQRDLSLDSLSGEPLAVRQPTQRSRKIPAHRIESGTAACRSPLIAQLLRELDRESVQYCHWKSNWQIDRWLTGDGDLDLLVAAKDICGFTAVLNKLGFRKVVPASGKDLPGVIHFYGLDEAVGKFIHIHAHYRLVFGHDLTKNYRLPIEADVVASAKRKSGIFVAAPEIELILFAIRMTLKVSAAETIARRILGRHRTHFRSIRDELAYLESRSEPAEVIRRIRTIFPMVEPEIFVACTRTLAHGGDIYGQLRAKYRLKRSLTAYARSSWLREKATSLRGRVTEILTRLGLLGRQSKRFESGGLIVAFVGGDGSGKSTCVKEVHRWLSKRFRTVTIHMGKPPKTAPTVAVAAAQIVAARLTEIRAAGSQSGIPENAGLLQQLRWLCTARDRYLLFKRACRFASNGGIVLSDRYPVEKISLMDGPKIQLGQSRSSESRITWPLFCMEQWYYRRILPPELLVVLRVDPETAVRRKTDEAPEHVRPRSTELWHIDWDGTRANVVDSGRELPIVLSDLRTLVWEAL
jgi:thymidylate kinase